MSQQPMESDDMFSNEENNIIINAVDGLPNVHPNYNELELEGSDSKHDSEKKRTLEELIHDEDLPTSLIVTNVDSSVFHSEEAKKKIKVLFSQFGEPESIQFFRSFKRMRVNYKCPAAAAKARIQLHQANFGNKKINCYFAQPVSPIDLEDQHLQPPALTKQFLISPPASPPVGWEPRDETQPLVNYDLLAAIANLTPGEAHELHPQQPGQPGIVVHVCEEPPPGVKPRIVHTRKIENEIPTTTNTCMNDNNNNNGDSGRKRHNSINTDNYTFNFIRVENDKPTTTMKCMNTNNNNGDNGRSDSIVNNNNNSCSGNEMS